MVSNVTTHLCQNSTGAATDKTNGHGCVPIKHLQRRQQARCGARTLVLPILAQGNQTLKTSLMQQSPEFFLPVAQSTHCFLPNNDNVINIVEHGKVINGTRKASRTVTTALEEDRECVLML